MYVHKFLSDHDLSIPDTFISFVHFSTICRDSLDSSEHRPDSCEEQYLTSVVWAKKSTTDLLGRNGTITRIWLTQPPNCPTQYDHISSPRMILACIYLSMYLSLFVICKSKTPSCKLLKNEVVSFVILMTSTHDGILSSITHTHTIMFGCSQSTRML